MKRIALIAIIQFIFFAAQVVDVGAYQVISLAEYPSEFMTNPRLREGLQQTQALLPGFTSSFNKNGHTSSSYLITILVRDGEVAMPVGIRINSIKDGVFPREEN